jgi:hypothetical protein
MTSPTNPPTPPLQTRDEEAAFIFEAGLTPLEFAFVQLLKGTRDHPGLSPAQFVAMATPLIAELRRSTPPAAAPRSIPPPVPRP